VLLRFACKAFSLNIVISFSKKISFVEIEGVVCMPRSGKGESSVSFSEILWFIEELFYKICA